MSPLAKTHAQGKYSGAENNGIHPQVAPYISERFELFINHMEVANSYSEQNDPVMQQKAFGIQQSLEDGNDDETHRMDDEFLEALRYGMPPTAGWGAGIDRLTMLFSGAQNIREVILFPMFRTSILSKSKQKK